MAVPSGAPLPLPPGRPPGHSVEPKIVAAAKHLKGGAEDGADRAAAAARLLLALEAAARHNRLAGVACRRVGRTQGRAVGWVGRNGDRQQRRPCRQAISMQQAISNHRQPAVAHAATHPTRLWHPRPCRCVPPWRSGLHSHPGWRSAGGRHARSVRRCVGRLALQCKHHGAVPPTPSLQHHPPAC